MSSHIELLHSELPNRTILLAAQHVTELPYILYEPCKTSARRPTEKQLHHR